MRDVEMQSPRVLSRVDFSHGFIHFLSLITTKPLDTEESFFLALPVIEEATRRLLAQYHLEFYATSSSNFATIQERIQNESIEAVQYLQQFSNGRYQFSELQNALAYLDHVHYLPGRRTRFENTMDSSNRARAFLGRAWRVMNPLLSIGVANETVLQSLAFITVLFLYLAWVFPFIRLMSAIRVISRHTFFPDHAIQEFSVKARFKEQMSRYRYLLPHDAMWFFLRLMGCFVWRHASTQVSLAIFMFGLAESILVRHRAVSRDAQKLIALKSEVEDERNLFLDFCVLAYQNGTRRSRQNHNLKVTIMGLYVASLTFALCALKLLSKDSPSEKYSWSWMGSLLGGFGVLLTCVFQMKCTISDKVLVPKMFAPSNPAKVVGEEEALLRQMPA